MITQSRLTVNGVDLKTPNLLEPPPQVTVGDAPEKHEKESDMSLISRFVESFETVIEKAIDRLTEKVHQIPLYDRGYR